MNNHYLEVISLIERLHRHFLEVVKLELEGLGIHDINNVQGMMLFNIGEAEMTVGELTLRGCYLGSNVSYNLKKMSKTAISRRNARCTIAARPNDRLRSTHQRHAEMLERAAIADEDLQAAAVTLGRLVHFWTRGPAINAAAA